MRLLQPIRFIAALAVIGAILTVLGSLTRWGRLISGLCAMAFTGCGGAGGAATPSQSFLPSSSGSANVSVVASPIANSARDSFVYEQPAQADSLVESVGVDTHFNYGGSPYDIAFPAVSGSLIASGIRHIRDGNMSLADYGARLSVLRQAGIRNNIGFPIDATADQISQAISLQAPYIDFVETANEYDASGGSGLAWISRLRAAQSLLYETVRKNSANDKLVVLGPSMAFTANFPLIGDYDEIQDAGNLHDYPCNGNPGSTSYTGIAQSLNFIRTTTTRPIWTTETGYTDDPSRPCALPDDVIAKYDPRMVAERFNAGESKTYFYEFADEPSDPVGGKSGLVTAQGLGKPQYFALANMIQLLSDRGMAFKPSPVGYAISGSTQNLHHLLLQKRDGTSFLLLGSRFPDGKHPLTIWGKPNRACASKHQSQDCTEDDAAFTFSI